MLFKSKKALNFLLKHGEVYTVRPRKRREGKDWITDKYGGNKIADATVKLVASIPSDRLQFFLGKYLRKSGFSSVEEWINEIEKLNKGIPQVLYLYHVSLLNSL